MLTPPELVWLLAAIAKGDEAAFARLYAASSAKLYGILLRILRSEELADAVMQETYLHVWRHAGQFDPRDATPITWMVATARSSAFDHLRAAPDAAIGDEPEVATSAARAEEPAQPQALGDKLKAVLACIGRLPPGHQRMILLAYYNGWSRDQLAAKFEQPPSLVKDWLRRGLLDVGKCLAHDG